MTLTSLRELTASVRGGLTPSDQPARSAATAVEAHNGELNALVSHRAGAAVEEASRLEVAGLALAGVPFTAKDMLATKDLPTTCGSRSLVGWQAGADATAVARMRSAGAVLVGKSNCPEFALGVDTNNDLFGRTRNPLGPWTPGGSSGGEAAAVSSGMSLVGLGSDYGGSIRWPAQCTGLVGLRPTVGRVSRAGEQPTLPGSDPLAVGGHSLVDAVQVVGPIGRTADDVHLALSVISGADGIDPLAVDEVLGDHRDVDVAGVEVRWGTDVGGLAVDPEVAHAVTWSVRALAELGARVTEGLPAEVSAGLDVYDRLRSAEPMEAIAALHARTPDLVGEPIKAILAGRRRIDDVERARLWAERERLIARLARWLTGERVLVLPVSLDVPRDLHGNVGNFQLLTPSRAISLFGIPSLSVPVGTSRSGAPVSVQVVAAAFREDVALAVGAALMQAGSSRSATSSDRRVADAC